MLSPVPAGVRQQLGTGAGLWKRWLGTLTVVVGVVVVGLSHGFINAPVVTHVAQSSLSQEIGATPVTTTYRFLERIGHVTGPFIVGQLFLLWGQRPHVLAWIGVMTTVLGLLFLIKRPPPRTRAVGSGSA